ncbi:TPA_asm: TRL2 dORF RNA iso1 [Human alphaherpesvirus 1]|nr:TPA_asm: IRL2 dORF RNA iso1 [Human alphaherpesvirus 1]DAC85465.1 TPA_asm: TRL2 dORF RNA iso1 [Human alphaherpesvirus 1]
MAPLTQTQGPGSPWDPLTHTQRHAPTTNTQGPGSPCWGRGPH